MAYVHDEYCLICKKITMHVNTDCTMCMKKEKQKRDEYWQRLSVEAKLNLLMKRIEKLEARGRRIN